MQLKYSFKKESMHFFRTFRFVAILLIVFGFAIGNPLMFKFCAVVLGTMDMGTDSGADTSIVAPAPDNSQSVAESSVPDSTSSTPTDIFGGLFAAVTSDGQSGNQQFIADPEDPMGALNEMMGEMGMDDVMSVYSDAGLMFATTISTFAGGALLAVMLLLMQTAGGELKKRAMIVPMSVGLEYKNYLLPKFVIYPLTNMAITFVATMVAGGLCNLMFPNNKVSMEIMQLSAWLLAIYVGFIVSVYLALGLCTSKPGIMAATVYVSQTLLQSILAGFGLNDYHPFALLTYVSGIMVMEDFVLEEHAVGIVVSAALSIAIAVGMYFLTFAVLGAKKINNQAEIEPEF